MVPGAVVEGSRSVGRRPGGICNGMSGSFIPETSIGGKVTPASASPDLTRFSTIVGTSLRLTWLIVVAVTAGGSVGSTAKFGALPPTRTATGLATTTAATVPRTIDGFGRR